MGAFNYYQLLRSHLGGREVPSRCGRMRTRGEGGVTSVRTFAYNFFN